jgi:hypothetical protein
MRAILAALTAVALACPVLAQTTPPQRIKGTIEAFAAPSLTVKTDQGKTVEVTLSADAKIIANEKSTLADIKPGDFVASAAQLGPDGKLHSQELRIFPEPLRGMGEGQYPMDTPNRSMTNATVLEVNGQVKASSGVLKLTFHGSTAGAGGACTGHASGPGKGNCEGQTELVIDKKVPVTKWVLGDASWLETGKAVSLFAATGPEGKLSARGVVVERGGIKPLP